MSRIANGLDSKLREPGTGTAVKKGTIEYFEFGSVCAVAVAILSV